MFFFLIVAISLLLIVAIKWNYSYWQRQGFPYVEPKIPAGALSTVFSRERSFGTAIYDVYESSKERFLGIYALTRPMLLIRDAQLAHDVLEKNFSSFHDRGVYVDEEHDPMSAALFFLKGLKWKTLRTKLTPTFSSGKLKAMFGTVEDVSVKMVNHLNSVIGDKGSTELELKSIITTYAVDIIGSVIYGLELNSYENPNNEFKRVSNLLNTPGAITALRGTCQFLYPNLEKLFQRLGWSEEGPDRMKDVVIDTIRYREKHNVVRRDMLQLLLQLRNTGSVSTDDNVWSAQLSKGAITTMSDEMIAAQLFLFYVAGYETTASTVSFTIYELSKHPSCLEKAIRDVEESLAKNDGKLSYEAIHDMKYLDLCVKETTRKYPGLPILNRECTEDFPIPDSNLVIKKGTPIVISLLGIHRDEEYFPNPTGYEPERFAEENMNYNPVAYMPFGVGPRHCIAARMGVVNAKVAIAQILMNFNIEINKDNHEIEFANYGIPLIAAGGINVRLSKKINRTSG